MLFAIVFLWQIPHFMAIAWLYRDDYGKAGFPMLPVIEPEGRSARPSGSASTPGPCCPVSLLPTVVGLSGRIYFWIALLLGSAMVWLSWRFAVDPIRTRRARAVHRVDHLPAAHLGGDDSQSLTRPPS